MKFSEQLEETLTQLVNGKTSKEVAIVQLLDSFKESHKITAQIIAKGKAMRMAQKDYFKNRRSLVLEESKRLEREFDSLVATGKPNPSQQKTMFND